LEDNNEEDSDELIDKDQVEEDENQDYQIEVSQVIVEKNFTPIVVTKQSSKFLNNNTPEEKKITKKLVNYEIRRQS